MSRLRGAIAALLLVTVVVAVYVGSFRPRVGPTLPLPALPTNETDPAVADALAHARERAAANPTDVDARGLFGKVLFVHGHTTAAAECFRAAAALEPDEYRWPYYLGLSLAETDPAAATEAYRRAAESGGSAVPPVVRFRLAESLLAAGQADEAAIEFRGLRASAFRPFAELGLARVAFQTGRTDEAIRSLPALEADSATRKAALLLKAELALRRNDPTAARAARTAAAAEPEPRSADDPLRAELAKLRVGLMPMLLQAERLAAAGRLDNARAVLDDAVARYPASAMAWEMLALTHRDAGNARLAEEFLRKALVLDPRGANSHLQLGILLYKSGRDEEAAESFGRVIDVLPGSAEAHQNRARALSRLGRHDPAAESARRAAAASPDNPRYRAALVEILRAGGKAAEARDALKAARETFPDDEGLRKLADAGLPGAPM